MTFTKENFIKILKGVVPTGTGSMLKNSVFNSVGPALNEWNITLKSQNAKYDSILTALSSDAVMICDRLAEEGSIDISIDPSEYISVVPEDVGNLIKDGFVSAATNCGYDPSTGLTITDKSGYAYNVFTSNVQSSVEGMTDVIATVPNVTDIRQAILYKMNGEWHFNNVLYSSNFHLQQPIDITEYSSIYQLIAMVTLKYTNTWSPTIIFALTKLCDHLNIAYTSDELNIVDLFGKLASHFNINMNTCHQVASDLYLIACSDSQPTTGYYTSVWSVINDLLESSIINQILQKSADILLNAVDKAAAFSALVTEYAVSKYASIREMVSNICTAYHKGGFYGVFKYLCNYARAQSSMYAEDGTLQFTDNSNLVPQVYTAGIVSMIVQGISLVAQIIASAINVAAGLIVAALGSIVNGVIGIFNTDYSDTYGQINLSEDCLYDMAPVAYYQAEFTVNKAIEEALESTGLYFGIIPVPGGYIMYGPGSYDATGFPATIRMEFHPMTASYVSWVKAFNDQFIANNQLSVESEAGNLALHRYYIWLDIDEDDVSSLISTLCTIYSSYEPDKIFQNDDTGYVYNDDSELIESIACNVGAFEFFLYLVNHWGGMMPIGGTVIEALNTTPVVYREHGSQLVLWFDRFTNLAWEYDNYSLNVSSIGAGGRCYNRSLSWSNLFTKYTEVIYPLNNDGFIMLPNDMTWLILTNRYFYGVVAEIPAKLEYSLVWPKYDRKSFISSCIIAGLITVAVVAVAVGVSIGVKKAVTAKRAQHQAKVEKAWEDFKGDPTAGNYKAFKKQAFKNNMFASMFGGTKYSYNNYWETSSSAPAQSDKIGSGLQSIFATSTGDVDTDRNMSWEFNEMYRKIVGSPYSS